LGNRDIIKHKITLLDLGGVVFQSSGISNDRISWATINFLNKKYGPRLDLGEDCFSEFLHEYNLKTSQHLTGRVFLKEIFDTLEFNESLIQMLNRSSDIIIVSDNYKESIEYISRRYNFSSWSVKQVYSFQYRMFKSNPKFFEKLLTEINHYNVEDMVFIDDSRSKLESANKCGIKGILFENNEQVRNDLFSD